jgi:hypothetical protein
MPDDITQHDARRRRCPMLGHEVHFGYCRAPGRELPCGRIFDCWFEAFDVEAFVRAHYSEADVARILAPRKPKVVSIVELIEQARRSAAEGGGGPAGEPPGR